MGVAVYPRLNTLLRERNLTVAELERRIEQRYGLTVDPKTLYRLTAAAPVQRADLEIAGAVAALLDVGLDQLFDIHAVPVGEEDKATPVLDAEQSLRLSELFDRQARRSLTSDEQDEIEALVTDYGRRLHERRLHELAQRHGISLDEARREAASRFEEALAWWSAFEANPALRATAAKRARGGRRRTAE
jgi:transposase